MSRLNWLKHLSAQVIIMTSSFGVQAADSIRTTKPAIAPANTNSNAFFATTTVQPSKSSTATSTTRADQLETEEIKPSHFSISADLSQSRNLVDFQDGSREDTTELLVVPSYRTSLGRFSAKIQYAQNQTDSEDINNGFADALLTYTYPPIDWDWSPPSVIYFSPGLTLVAPLSQVSQKQTELQTSTILNFTLGIKPDELYKSKHLWKFIIVLTAGRNFHPYEEDINGAILNKYSSNQALTIGYDYSDWSVALDLINRSRWTYKGNVRQSFIANQQVTYSLTSNLSLAVGHTNEASAQKADGSSSNLNFIDEKTSTVYATVGVNF